MGALRIASLLCVLACAAPGFAQTITQPPATPDATPEQKPFDKPQGIYASIERHVPDTQIRQLGQLIPTPRREMIAAAISIAPRLQPPVLYALANAMAQDLDKVPEAVFWYHVGRIRAVYDGLRCKDATARNAVNVLGKGLSPDVARYQRQNRAKTLEIAQRALKWDAENGRDYDHRWINLWGKVARYSTGTDPAELTVPESEWPAILKRVHEAHLKSVQEFANEKK